MITVEDSETDHARLRKVVLIGRMKSRRGAEAFRVTRERLEARGVTIHKAHAVTKKADLLRRIRRAIASKCSLIVVCGGDGTLSACVGQFAKTDAVLAVVPAGTGNSFALGLGIDSIDAAIEAILGGNIARVDLGRINGEYFADIAMVGLGSLIAENTSTSLKHVIGPMAYAVSALVPTITSPPFDLHVQYGHKNERLRTYQAIVAAGRYFGRTPIAPDARLTDGMLNFFAARDANGFDIVKTYLALLTGKQASLENTHFFSAKKITLKAKPAQRITLDGSSFGKTPARLSIARKALRVVVPATFSDHS